MDPSACNVLEISTAQRLQGAPADGVAGEKSKDAASHLRPQT
jgi:hypothetical protein